MRARAAAVIAAALPGGELDGLLRQLRADLAIEQFRCGRALLAAAETSAARVAVIELGLDDVPGAQLAGWLAEDRRKTVLLAGPRHDLRSAAAALPAAVQPLELPCTPLWLRMLLEQPGPGRASDGGDGAARAQAIAAVSAGRSALRAVTAAMSAGQAVDAAEVGRASAQLADLAHSTGLRHILELLRSHHDPTYAHSIRVAAGLTLFAAGVGMGDGDRRLLAMCGMLHDIGKIAVPHGVLSKPSRLDDDERTLVRRHPSIGEDVLRRSPGIPAAVIEVAARHHERLDGTGYPHGLDGQGIEDLSRLAAVVDVHVALTEPRAYKQPHSDEAAFALMLESERRSLEMSYLLRYRQMVLDTRHGGDVARRAGDVASAQPPRLSRRYSP
jgi:putative nucleotidyltransferase with HDIG domain